MSGGWGFFAELWDFVGGFGFGFGFGYGYGYG
jgi:hypothetical protein